MSRGYDCKRVIREVRICRTFSLRKNLIQVLTIFSVLCILNPLLIMVVVIIVFSAMSATLVWRR